MQAFGTGKRLSPPQEWIKRPLEKGTKPVMTILEEKGVWDVTEAVWIDRLAHEGVHLLNIAARVR